MNSFLPNSDLKKVGQTTRRFRYDLNQISYNYTEEVRNRFKGLDLIDRVSEELWMEAHDIVQEAVIKTIPKKKKYKKAKRLSEEALQIAVKRREVKGKGENERYTHLNAEFQRIARRDKKAFPSDQCKEIEENNRMGKTRDIFKKVRYTKGTFRAKVGTIKDRNVMDLKKQKVVRRGGKNTQKNYTKKIFMTKIIMMVRSLTWSQISWNVKSSGPQAASLQTKLVEVMEFQLSYFKF